MIGIYIVAVIALCFLALFFWSRQRMMYEKKLREIFLDTDISSLEVTNFFGLSRVYFQRSINPTHTNQTSNAESSRKIITIQIPNEIKLGFTQIKIPYKLGLVLESGTSTFIISTVDSPADGLFTHNFDDSVDTDPEPSWYQIQSYQHILSGKNFVHTDELIGMILTSFGQTNPVKSSTAGDIYFWIPSGTSVKKGDTLALMATKV
ncbi:hypothetical protein IID19_02925 [Patescibacteria group bacterium]|nr:hypothetical protein [Patescibacteria group bacterium]